MLKKHLLLVSLFAFAVFSCSSDDDPRDNYPQNSDISFSVTSTDNDRLCDIDIAIIGDGIDITNSSTSDSQLPYTKEYINQRITYSTTLNINYRDNSGGAVGVPFEPYTIKLTLRSDSEIKAEKEVTITESGTVDFVNFTFY